MSQSVCIIHPDPGKRREYVDRELRQLAVKPEDIIFLDSSPVTIENIRAVIKFLSRRPFSSTNKAVVIEANNLTIEAQQAFLKTLEEPPAYALLYLCVTHPELLLPTTLSRCRLITLGQDSTRKLAPTETQSLAAFWEQILENTWGKRLISTPEITQSRAETLIWLEAQINYWHTRLYQQYWTNSPAANLSPIEIATILRQLIHAHSLVESNVSLKLAIDHLFLRLPISPKTK